MVMLAYVLERAFAPRVIERRSEEHAEGNKQHDDVGYAMSTLPRVTIAVVTPRQGTAA